MLANKYENFAEIRKAFADAEKLGYGKQYIFAQLKKRKVSKKDLAVIFSGQFVADDFTKLITDSRLLRTLKERGISPTNFIDIGRLNNIYMQYNGRRFAGEF